MLFHLPQCHFILMLSQEIVFTRLNEENFVCKLCSLNTIGILESVLDDNKMSSQLLSKVIIVVVIPLLHKWLSGYHCFFCFMHQCWLCFYKSKGIAYICVCLYSIVYMGDKKVFVYLANHCHNIAQFLYIRI